MCLASGLRTAFGHAEFRGKQQEIVEAAVLGELGTRFQLLAAKLSILHLRRGCICSRTYRHGQGSATILLMDSDGRLTPRLQSLCFQVPAVAEKVSTPIVDTFFRSMIVMPFARATSSMG
jgi:hypothetical protein